MLSCIPYQDEVPVIYMHQFWATVIKHKSSYQFKIDKKRFSVNVEVFREIFNICPKVSGKAFDEPPTKEEALAFIHEPGHTGEIKYITDVIVDHLHQPWITFASITNKCLYGKCTGYHKVRLYTCRHSSIWCNPSSSNDKLALLDSVAYKTYHAIASGAELPMSKKNQKKSESAISSTESPSKKNFAKAQKDIATKPKPNKKKAHIKADQGKDDDDDDDYDNDDDDIDERVYTPLDYELHDEETIDDEEKIDEEEDDDVTKELYKYVNVNLGHKDADMTDADRGGADQQNDSQWSGFEQEEEDAHVTLTLVHDTQKTVCPTQSSSISFDFTNKLLNLENVSPYVNEIASLMDTATIPLPPPFFNPLSQQATPTLTPIASETTTSLPALLDFAFVFKFNKRVTNLEKDLLEMKQVDHSSSLLYSFSDFATLVIEKNVTKSLEVVVLARSSSQPKSNYETAASLSEFKLTKTLIDKMEKSKSYDKADYKKELYDALVKSYKTNKDLFDTYGEFFTLKRSRDDRDKDQDPFAGSDRGMKRRKLNKDAESSRDSRSKEKKSSSTSKDASYSQQKPSGKSAHAEEPSHTVDD
uniref:Uncharacterized protein n=1 Tax=Tanacetum cinerariifolium TaxID=118510 RepID=A0A699GKD1_TANCI|nr:hypothetical protein [Tanacetum cinerariifolium]